MYGSFCYDQLAEFDIQHSRMSRPLNLQSKSVVRQIHRISYNSSSMPQEDLIPQDWYLDKSSYNTHYK